MKREFPFDMALKALEVTWSSLPPATADTKVGLPIIPALEGHKIIQS